MAGDLEQFMSKLGSKQRDQRVKRFFIDQHDRRYFAWADKDNQRPIGEFQLTDKPQRADKLSRFVTAPWNPSMSYIDWPDADTLDFRWKFDALASEWAGYTAEWYSLAQQMAESAKVTVPEVGGVCDPKLIGLMGPPPMSPEIPLAAEAGEKWIIGVRDAKVNVHLRTILNMGRAITSTLAMDVIRLRVQAMIDAQDAGDLEAVQELSDLSSVTIPGAGDFLGHSEPVRGAEPDVPFDPSAIKYPEFVAAGRKQGLPMPEIIVRWREHKANLAEAVAA